MLQVFPRNATQQISWTVFTAELAGEPFSYVSARYLVVASFGPLIE
jgi:hypothetical protein